MERRFLSLPLVALIISIFLASCSHQYLIKGPQGGISTHITLPKGFNPESDSCDMVILMHGVFSSKDYPPMPEIARYIAKKGIASISLDFGGHGKSEGEMQKMTIGNELSEAKAVWEYAQKLPYVKKVSLLGHSQGGVVASMLAGELALENNPPRTLILLAPGSVIKEATQAGHFFGNQYDPNNPPEYIKCFKTFRLGRDYMLTTPHLDIYGVSALYHGPVCIIHGNKDGIVPLWCSEKYDSIYENSTYHLIEGENHLMIKRLSKTKRIISDFLNQSSKPRGQ